MNEYPPEPWDLRGQLHASVFLMPLHEVPVAVPPGHRPVRLGRRAVVATAWVDYEPGGVLAYREFMATVLVRRGARLLPTITHIWVDSRASCDGGRALWAIPKQLGEFAFTGNSYAVRDEHGPIASGVVRRLVRLPGRWPVGFRVAQARGDAALVSRVRCRARLGLSRARLAAEADGPLAFLAGHRPLLSLTVADFRMSFGG